MTSILKDFMQGQMQALAFLNSPQRLSAIWRTENPVWLWDYSEDCKCMELKRTVRITDKQTLRVENGQIVDCKVGLPPNYLVEECHGAERHSFSLVLKDLVTKKNITFKL